MVISFAELLKGVRFRKGRKSRGKMGGERVARYTLDGGWMHGGCRPGPKAGEVMRGAYALGVLGNAPDRVACRGHGVP
jgi:hypothetical protein